MSITGTSHNDSGLFFIQFKSTDISYSILRQSSLLAQVLFVNITSSHHHCPYRLGHGHDHIMIKLMLLIVQPVQR